MDQTTGLASPKIVSLAFTPLEYVLPLEKAYGMARGLNFRRTVALVAVTADDGSTGYGEALGPLAPIGEYLALLRPFFLGRSISISSWWRRRSTTGSITSGCRAITPRA
jgi:L-alanine-DL-glutamate epimerase-like enolase superfamily enzyme